MIFDVRTIGWWVFGGCVLLPPAPYGIGYSCNDESPCPGDLVCVADVPTDPNAIPTCRAPCDHDGDCQFRHQPSHICGRGYCYIPTFL